MGDNLLDNRINEFIDAVMKVARGDYSVQLELSEENNHLDALAMGINMMVDDLKKGRDTELENDRIKLLNTQLLEANAKALESDRLKTMFLQNMSHEIRTPLNAIIGFSDLLPKYFRKREKLLQFSAIIKQNGIDLLELINDILDLSRIETGQFAVNLEECNLSELLSDLHTFFDNYSRKINKTHIKLQYSTVDALQQQLICTDKGKIKQIFVNLIHNALKFTDSGEVKFGYFMNKDHQIEYFVSDTGIGIPTEKQSAVFERFVQLGNGAANMQKGTGLGLSIVKGLIELLGGNLTLQSAIDKGSTFYFTVPYVEIGLSAVKTVAAEEHSCINWGKYTILIVEDDVCNSRYLEEVLSETGVNILIAANGDDAIDMVNSKDPNVDLVLMDVKLPGISGLEVTGILKNKYPEIKIIAQTAFASNEDRKRALRAGCDDFISKPIIWEQLLEIINKQLNLL